MQTKILTFLKLNFERGGKMAKSLEEVQEREKKIALEFERVLKLFEGLDEKQLELSKGPILEYARLKIELEELHEIQKKTGSIKLSQRSNGNQEELPVTKVLVKTRANYLNYYAKLSNILGKNILDEDDEELEGYE